MNRMFLGKPNIRIIQWCKEHHEEKILNYLCFTALEANSNIGFSPKIGEYQFSTTGTAGLWIDYDKGLKITLANEGCKVYFKAKTTNSNVCDGDYFGFLSTAGKLKVSGSIMSLLDLSCPDDLAVPNWCFTGLFADLNALIDASELQLPSMTLGEECYSDMFSYCPNLILPPKKLPATIMAPFCYGAMFASCESLLIMPLIDAETLAWGCFTNMFNKCTKLSKIKPFKFKYLDAECCQLMFSWCSNLKISETPVDGSTLIMDLTELQTADRWSLGMYICTSGTFTDDPVVGKKYYCYS